MSWGLEVEGLRVRRGRRLVLRGAALRLGRGETGVVMGPNGSGKTTLLEAVAGIVRPEAGRIAVAGRLVYDERLGLDTPPERRRIAYVPQDYGLFPHMTVRENILLPLRVRRVAAREAEERLRSLAGLLGLEGLLDRRPGQLSGGQKQRAAIARALAADPELVLLDEPFSALDAASREKLRPLLRRVLRVAGATALLVTHSFSDAWLLGDKLYMLSDGVLGGGAAPADMAAAPLRHGVAEALGYNVLEARYLGQGAAEVEGVGTLQLGGTPGLEPGQRMRIAFRCDDVVVAPPSQAPNRVEAVVVEAVLTRYAVRLQLRADRGAEITAEAPRGHLLLALGRLPRPGDRLPVAIPPQAIDYAPA